MMERDAHRHGDLLIVTERRSDGTLVVRIDPGKENLVEIHQYAKGGLVR
jgi:hypothetical protein